MRWGLFLLFLWMCSCSDTASNSLTSSLDQGNGEPRSACPGEEVNYTCTIIGTNTESTHWEGSAFNCPDDNNPIVNNQIVLPHSQFSLTGTSGTCGALAAQSQSVNGSCYTSVLTVPGSAVTEDLDGATIGCSISGVTPVGEKTLTVIPPPLDPPPTAFTCTIVEDGNGSVALNVTDSGTSFTDNNGVEDYCVRSMEATCDDTLPCVSQCTGLMDGQTFTFTFFAVNCGDQNGPESSESVTVSPRAPPVPDVDMTVQYSVSGDLLSIAANWTEETLTIVTPSSVCEVSSPTPPSGCTVPGDFQDGDVLYYVTYQPDLGDGNTSCPVSCNSGECMDVFDQFQPGSSSYTVTVSASNVVGTTATTNFNIDRTNNLLSVGPLNFINSFEAAIECQFPSGFSGICTADCGTDPTFMNHQPWGQSAPGSGGEIQLQPPQPLDLNTTYYCIISATVNGVNVRAQATFTTPVNFNCVPNVLGAVDSITDSECFGLLGGSISSATIPNGTVCFNGTTRLESDALYICNDGYELLIPEGATNPRECQFDGMWSGSDLTCVETSSVSSSSSSSPISAIIGGVVGGVILLILVIILVVVIVFCVHHKPHSDTETPYKSEKLMELKSQVTRPDEDPEVTTDTCVAYGAFTGRVQAPPPEATYEVVADPNPAYHTVLQAGGTGSQEHA